MKTAEVKEKLRHEMVEYGINVLYLALVFASFTIYRRLLLAAYGIDYTNYWFALVKALVLGKVIMIGSLFGLGRGLEKRPLIFPTLYKTVVFCVFCALFTVVEHTAVGLWKGEGLAGGLADLSGKGLHELLANTLVVFVSFVPFFGVKELGRVVGESRIRTLFFRTSAESTEEAGA